MNPNTTPLLYESVAAPNLDKVVDESNRRAMLSKIMGDLDIQFKDIKQISYVTDPLIATRLIALGRIQFTELGISGFDPMDLVNGHEGFGTAKGYAAPAHDTHERNGLSYKTRLVKFETPEYGYRTERDITIIGLNFYLADGEQEIEEFEGTTPSGLIITATPEGGEAVVNGTPITGDINIFVVYNQKSSDAKAYKITQIGTAESEELLRTINTPMKFITPTSVQVVMPNATIMLVETLHDKQVLELMTEFDDSLEILEKSTRNQKLTEAEIIAARAVGYRA